jgi:hypothetical protein
MAMKCVCSRAMRYREFQTNGGRATIRVMACDACRLWWALYPDDPPPAVSFLLHQNPDAESARVRAWVLKFGDLE